MTRDTTSPAHSPSPAGYEAEAVDPALRSYLAVCDKSIRQAQLLGERVELVLERLGATPTTTDMTDANEATLLFERTTKACLNLVKALDELSRLRSFLSGGPDSRPDLTARGEIELRVLLVMAVKELGWSVTDSEGRPVSVEEA